MWKAYKHPKYTIEGIEVDTNGKERVTIVNEPEYWTVEDRDAGNGVFNRYKEPNSGQLMHFPTLSSAITTCETHNREDYGDIVWQKTSLG